MTRRAIVALLLLAGGAGCTKSGPPADERAPEAGATTAKNAVAAAPDASADGGTGPGASGKAASFVGKYTVTAGSMYVPAQKDWASVKFKNDETKLLGDGELTVTVDGAGRVSGGSETGPLGASVLEGRSDGKTLTAVIRRKNPSDEGLTGTLQAKVTGDSLDGTMNLAEANAAVVRTAQFQAKKK